MKKNLLPLLFIFIITAFNSCGTDEAMPEPEVLPEAVDTYKYIALRNDGQLFEIGNLTGKISAVNKIPGMEFNTNFNAVTSSSTHLYVYEHFFPPVQSKIHVYNLTTKATQTHAISFPEEVFGEFPGLVSLEWDETNSSLVGLVKEHYEQGPNHNTIVARIDPTSFEVASMNIAIDKAHIISTQLIDTKIYVSTYKTSTGSGTNEFFQIDLGTGTLNTVELSNMVRPPIHLSKNASNHVLFGFLPTEGSNYAGAARPVLINPTTRQVTELFPNEVIGTKNFNGRSFFNPFSQEHVDIITSATYFGLFQYNISTNKEKITTLQFPNDLSSLVAIVDVKKV